MLCQSAAFKAGARRRTCVSRSQKAESHGSTFAKSLLAATTFFVACNDRNLPRKLPSQYNIAPRASNNNQVKMPPHQRNNAEERLYSATNHEEFLKDLRKLQARTKCTNTTCVNFIQLFTKYVGEAKGQKGFRACDKKLKEAAGVDVIELHGCKKCNRHVFLPNSARTRCPHCGGARYDAKGKPQEVCLIFKFVFEYMFTIYLR